MIDNEYSELEGRMYESDSENIFGKNENESSSVEGVNDFDDFDDSVSEIDFSQFSGGDFKSSFKKVNHHVNKNSFNRKRKRSAKKPLSKEFEAGKRSGETHTISGNSERKLGKVIVPRDKKVIVEGVSSFILSDSNDAIKNIGYYKGKKLKKLILTFNNDSALDFNLELFNPSMPLDYLYSTGLNLNDKIQVAGGAVSYSDVLFNLLANPTLIVQCTVVVAGAASVSQLSQALRFTNKEISGEVKINPQNLNLNIDNMQVANDMVYFDVTKKLNRPFIPDGMDVIKYVIKAGMTVTLAMYYKQISLKRVLFPEARENKELL